MAKKNRRHIVTVNGTEFYWPLRNVLSGRPWPVTRAREKARRVRQAQRVSS